MNRKFFLVAVTVLSMVGVMGCDRSAAPSDASSDVSSAAPTARATTKPSNKSTATGKEDCPSIETAKRVLTKAFPLGGGPAMPTEIECPDGDGLWAIGTTPDGGSLSLFNYAGAYGWEYRESTHYEGDGGEEPGACHLVGPKVRERLADCTQE